MRKWSYKEINILKSSYKDKILVKEIAKLIDRTEFAISERKKKKFEEFLFRS